jgi:hypothetical protein
VVTNADVTSEPTENDGLEESVPKERIKSDENSSGERHLHQQESSKSHEILVDGLRTNFPETWLWQDIKTR